MHFFDAPPPDVPNTVIAVMLGALIAFKFAAYLVAGKVLTRAFPNSGASPIAISLCRLILGALGAWGYSHAAHYLPWPGESNPILHVLILFCGLFCLRVFEWWATLALFFDGALREAKRGWFCAIMAAIYTQALDIPCVLVMQLALHYWFWYGAI
jgi:hypothetical protein